MLNIDRHLKYLLTLADIGHNYQPGVTDISGPRNQDVLQSFVVHCQAKGLKSKTLQDYITRLSYLINYTNRIDKSAASVTRSDLEAYISTTIGTVSAATVNGRITVWKLFYNYLATEDYVGLNPMKHIHRIKEDVQIKPILTVKQLELLLNQFDTKRMTGYRNRLMILTAVDTCVRIGELVGIKREDCHINDRVITVRHTKGHRDRQVPFSPRLAESLHNWEVKYRRALPGDYLFCYKNGDGPMNTDRLRKILDKAKRQIGLKQLSPQTLRRSGGCWLHQSGLSVEMIRRLMGHRDIRTTQGYIQVDGFDALQEAHDRHSVLSQLGVG